LRQLRPHIAAGVTIDCAVLNTVEGVATSASALLAPMPSVKSVNERNPNLFNLLMVVALMV
jgi:hypothetical protein